MSLPRALSSIPFPYTTLFRSEIGQAPTFHVTNNTNAALFSVQPSIGTDGTLTYTSAVNAFGVPSVPIDRKSTRLNSSHVAISYAVFCLKKKNMVNIRQVMANS